MRPHISRTCTRCSIYLYILSVLFCICSLIVRRSSAPHTQVRAYLSTDCAGILTGTTAPSAIFIAVIGTGLIGWLLNIIVVLCSGPLENLPGPSGSAFLEILAMRMGKPGALFVWVRIFPIRIPPLNVYSCEFKSFVCLTAFFVSQTALQACSRTVYAFSRDHGLPDRGYFGRVSRYTTTPLRAIWFTTILSILPGLLDLASPIAANAIFALTAMALDFSYIIPIFL